MARYRFVTTWCLDAPLEAVWTEIAASEQWPEWWPGVLRNDCVRAAEPGGAGAVYACEWRGLLPYTVAFSAETLRVERPQVIELRATGELEGRGTWRLYDGPGTCAVYDWDVETTRAWMNAVAPVGRPVFAWSHHWVMRRGGEALARRLGCRLLAQT